VQNTSEKAAGGSRGRLSNDASIRGREEEGLEKSTVKERHDAANGDPGRVDKRWRDPLLR